jgi:hypothetical protein
MNLTIASSTTNRGMLRLGELSSAVRAATASVGAIGWKDGKDCCSLASTSALFGSEASARLTSAR